MPEQKIMPVNVERLTRRMGKYALVVAVSQRTRELKDRQARNADISASSLVGNALKEIAEGKVKIMTESATE
jgi:DNA-directed RNA polymerase subunit K/omega